jgi:hypothetical protein
MAVLLARDLALDDSSIGGQRQDEVTLLTAATWQ